MQPVLASVLAMAGGRSWWNRPMVWASLAAMGSGGWLAVRRSRRRAEREAAEADAAAAMTATDPDPAAADHDPMDEAMNRLGRDWQPDDPTDPAP